MSPTIRSKGGLPLMIGGRVAGADECCCENPPPPACFCADLCSYDIELLSPAITSVRTPANDCLAFTFQTNTTSDFVDDWMFPDTDFGDFVPCTEAAGLVGVIKPVSVFSVARRWTGDFEASTWVYVLLCEPSDPATEEAIVSIRVKLRMACDPTTEQLYVEVQSSAYVGDFDDESNRSSIVVSNYGFYRPPSTCLVPGKRICVTDPAPWFRTAFLDTPLDITVRLDETSLGPYTLGLPGGEERGGSPNPFRAMFDSVVENTEFTFRITSRPSCKTVECDCNAGRMQGTAWTFMQGDVTRECAWSTNEQGGDNSFQEWGDSPYYIYWSGTGYFYLERFGTGDYVAGIGGLVTERHTALFECTEIDGVPTWTVTIQSECIQYNEIPNQTHRSIDTWVGRLECYEACEDNYHTAGEPIPSGELVDVEYIERWTAPFYSECTPPARITLSGRQIVAPC